ncbi:MAG: TIGR03089 family protein [Micrococcus sp.]|nr:TIGR03089 family protein [Micrococcus sp.]
MVTLGTPDRSGRGPADWFEAVAASPRPAVVDYAAGEDRVELSGRVLANWAAKTANLLDAEGLGAGSTVAVDLPAGWQPLAALLGLARAGVGVVFTAAGAATDADLVITDDPSAWEASPAELWAVAPEDGQAPAHALDFTAEVRVQADRCPLPVPHGDLVAQSAHWADDAADGTAGVTDRAGTGPARWIRRERGLVVAAQGERLHRGLAGAVLQAWAAGLPVVLVPADHADDDGAARIVAAERLGGLPGEGGPGGR